MAGKVLTLGHELAILAYIERKCPAVAGADEREWAVSQQFVHQAEDAYKALVAKQPTLYETDKVSKEALAEWWAGDDRTLHNRKQGLQVHLALLEAAAAATRPKAGLPNAKRKVRRRVQVVGDVAHARDDQERRAGAVSGARGLLRALRRRSGDEASRRPGGRFPGPLKRYFV